MKKIFLILCFFQVTVGFAQSDSVAKFTFSGFADLYYSYDFSSPKNHEKPDFVYNHKRHNELNINLMLARVAYSEKNIRANVGLMAGNYAQYNLSSEPTWAQFIYEANVGVKLSKNRDLWFDAGILPSHIGFESAISADCWTLTRSLVAENSPYYEAGARLSYSTQKNKLNVAFLALNGWQRIQKPDAIQNPSFGMLLSYQPSEKITFTYTNFLGSDQPDSVHAIRFFNDFFVQYQPSRKFGLIACLDVGRDKYNVRDYGMWYIPTLILRYSLRPKVKLALRGEYCNDKHQIIVPTNTPNGFQVLGLSTNVDYRISDKVQIRLEGKVLNASDKLFLNQSKQNISLTTNLTIRL